MLAFKLGNFKPNPSRSQEPLFSPPASPDLLRVARVAAQELCLAWPGAVQGCRVCGPLAVPKLRNLVNLSTFMIQTFV